MQLWANRKQFEYRYHNHYDYDDAAHLLLLLTNANHCLLQSYYTNGVHSVYHQQYERVCLIDRWHLTKCTGIVHSLSVVIGMLWTNQISIEIRTVCVRLFVFTIYSQEYRYRYFGIFRLYYIRIAYLLTF